MKYTKNVDLSKIWQIMGNVEACKEVLESALKAKDFEAVQKVANQLEKVKERLDKLTEE